MINLKIILGSHLKKIKRLQPLHWCIMHMKEKQRSRSCHKSMICCAPHSSLVWIPHIFIAQGSSFRLLHLYSRLNEWIQPNKSFLRANKIYLYGNISSYWKKQIDTFFGLQLKAALVDFLSEGPFSDNAHAFIPLTDFVSIL